MALLPELPRGLNVSNNSESKKKQMVERVIGKSITSRTTLLDLNQLKENSSRTKDLAIRQSQTKYKIDAIQTTSKFDKFDREADQKYGHSSGFFPKPKRDNFPPQPKAARRDSMRPLDARLPMSNKMSLVERELQLHKFTLGETIEESQSDNDLTTMANVHLSQREQALKLLADIQVKMEKRRKAEDEEDLRRSSHTITPQEALQCAWLRLSKAQIATLEELIRQQGKDPGIHAHSDVTNYDVFAEIREIRNREKILKEED